MGNRIPGSLERQTFLFEINSNKYMRPWEKLNSFVDEKIAPLRIDNKRGCEINGILDWIMQKGYSKTLQYQSWPDGKQHTVHDGLMEVFDYIQELGNKVREMEKIYNEELHKLYTQIDSMPNKEQLEELDRLNTIRELLKK